MGIKGSDLDLDECNYVTVKYYQKECLSQTTIQEETDKYASEAYREEILINAVKNLTKL